MVTGTKGITGTCCLSCEAKRSRKRTGARVGNRSSSFSVSTSRRRPVATCRFHSVAGYNSGMPVPLLDLRAQHAHIRDEVVAAIMGVVDSQLFILGEPVAQLEEEVASLSRTKYAIGC